MEVERQESIEADPDLAAMVETELDEPRWSVVSFDRREAGSLTYAEAAERMSKLSSDGVAGLCIVTDEAAGRVSR